MNTLRRSAIAAVVLAGLALAGLAWSADAPAVSDEDMVKKIDPSRDYFPALRAQLVPTQKLYFVGQPLLVDFQVVNATDEPALLKVPYQSAPTDHLTAKHLAAGLPMEHVFSRKAAEGVTARRALVINAFDDPITELDNNVTHAPTGPVEPIIIRPRGIVGARLDLAKLYPSLAKPGRYIIQWRPYSDALRSLSTEIRVMTEEKAIIDTTMGKMEVRFFYDKAPNHVDNFLSLARNGFYNGTLFHRIIEGFMIQAGDPLTSDPAKSNEWGTGRGPRMLKQEFNDTPFVSGVLGAARGPDVNSASCQFFIVAGEASHLNGQYTAFGQLMGAESQKVADKISKVETFHGQRNDPRNDRPLQPVKINRITVEPLRAATTQPATQPGQ